jgi:hypothetical protein
LVCGLEEEDVWRGLSDGHEALEWVMAEIYGPLEAPLQP